MGNILGIESLNTAGNPGDYPDRVEQDRIWNSAFAKLDAHAGYSARADNPTFYVNPTGSDLADGSKQAAFLTVDRALAALPAVILSGAFVILASGTYTLTPNTTHKLPIPVGPASQPFCFIGELVSMLGNLTASNPDAAKLTLVVDSFTASPLVVDAWAGSTLLCVSGANSGSAIGILNNSTSSFTAESAFPNAISTGDVFQVQQPGTEIVYSANNFYGPALIVSKGIRWKAASATVGLTANFSMRILCESTEFHMNNPGGNSVNLQMSHYAGIDGFAGGGLFPSNSANNPGSSKRTFSAYIHDGNVQISDRSIVPGPARTYLKNAAVVVAQNSQWVAGATNGKNVTFTMRGQSQFAPASMTISGSKGDAILKVEALSILGGAAAGAALAPLGGTLNGSAGSAISGSGGSYLFLGALSGSGSVRYGVEVNAGCFVKIASGSTIVSGTLGNLLCGRQPLAYLDVYASGGFTEVFSGSVTMNRIEP